MKNLPPFIEKSQITDSGRGDSFYFSGTEEKFAELCARLPEIDRPVPRVRYDLLIMQYQSTDGFSWSPNFKAGRVSLGDMNSASANLGSVLAVSRFAGENSENLVLRLLDVGKRPLELEKLGFSESQCAVLQRLLNHNDGLILICGATGSGKSTTAASLLLEIEKIWQGRKKIVSIEDPPEYAFENVTQIKVDENFGMSFSDSLRFVFRQDPDVIFIGELRDESSARTAIQAAITGHLVFATVHAGGIEECVLRIKELGAEISLLRAAVRGIVFQRLDFFDGKPSLFAEIFCGKKNFNEFK